MPDFTWLVNEARSVHGIFESLFYDFAVVLLSLGVLIEYFKVPVGGIPSIPQLVGRTLIAGILLVSYPEIINAISSVSDAMADKIGGLGQYQSVLDSAGKAVENLEWSWTSVGKTFVYAISYLAFFIVHFSVY